MAKKKPRKQKPPAKRKPAKKQPSLRSPPAKKKKPAPKAPTRAQKEKIRKLQFSRKTSAADAEIGPPPITAAQEREGKRLREAIWDNLILWDTEVFPNSSGLKPYGEVQLQSIAQDYEIIVKGGRVVRAEPRAFTKTTRTSNHALWGILTGRRRMIPVFSANLEKSKTQIMQRWKNEILTNDRLLWMFPHLVWPLRALENKSQRCKSQTYNKKMTHVQWNSDRIVFPHSPGEPGSGCILIALPLASCRGATHSVPAKKGGSSTILRPDLVIFDDVQRDEDADNPNTVRKLRKLIQHSALMLGGHSRTMSAIMNCTIRQIEDLGEQFLKDASWRRVRYKMLTKPATHEKEFWLTQYADVRRAFDPESKEDQTRAKLACLELYKANRDYADHGAEVTWEWAYAWEDEVQTEISAIQHAYNIMIDEGADVFASECQNEPIRDTGGLVILTADEIRRKQSGYKRGVVPKECVKLTSFIDVHEQILYFQVWGWEPLFSGFMLEDETFPNQRTRSFSHALLPVSLDRIFPGLDDSARVTAALDALIHGNEQLNVLPLLGREWIRTDGVPLKIDLLGIDANGTQSDAIKKFIRQSPFSSHMYASYGHGITASKPPMSTWQEYRKQICGPEWIPTKPVPGDPIGIKFDTNHWKTRWHRCMSLAKGSQGAIYLYEADPEHHQLFGEHANSELPSEVTCRGRIVYEFPSQALGDNHKFDTAVGCMVAASKAGITSIQKPPPRKKVTLQELRARAAERRRMRGR